MGYKDEFQERQYRIMIMREHHNMTFPEIGRAFGFSRESARQLYAKAKLLQKRLYLHRIGEATGQSDWDMDMLSRRLRKEFGDNCVINAWLEREYKDILDEYRAGEPKSAYEVDENTPRPRKVHPNTCKTISIGSYRMAFTEQELLILNERDQKGTSLEEIGRLTGMSESQAKYAYRTAKLVQFRRYVKIISEKTGGSFDEIKETAYRSGKTLHDRIAYLEKEYGGILENPPYRHSSLP